MTIITENKYLDECTFSGGNTKDEDCLDITDWTTDGDTGTGESTATFFDNKSCFKMDVVSAGGGNLASRSLDVGSFATPAILSVKLYHDTLGTFAAGDYFEFILQDTSYRLSIRFASDGLFIYDGAAWNEVGTNIVQTDTWQEWSFNWTVAASGVVAVYLNGVLQVASVDCSDSTAGTDGTTTFRQYGTTVIGLTYIDWIKLGTAFRYGGETWILQEGAQLTIRTDTRWYANSPASMLGSLGSQTVTEGKLIYDGTDVRWLAYDTGTGNVPAVGTSITQGAVSGYLLGVWDSLTSAPTAVGASMPSDGFIKFREVAGGAYSVGALTGIGANATATDVTGWIEIVADSASTITVGRLGEHEIRGDWFYLDNTNGSVGQQIQIPTNGGGSLTYCPGAWVETGTGTGIYEYWPSAAVAADGWSISHLGAAYGETDRRQNFVKDVGGGLIQFGEASNLAGTYANVAAQASTYAIIAHTSTYIVASNVCTVTYTTGHLLKTGQQVGIDFTSGGAAALDGLFTVTVLDAFTYYFSLTTGNTSGACTVRPGLTISFTAHVLGVGDSVYCDFTSGGGADGDYEIYAVTSANAYLIKYPTATTITSGNVSVYSRYAITYTAHGLAVSNRVYLDFTTGSGVDGIYPIVAVPDANTFHVVANNNASADSGNVTIKQTIGNVPVSGCKVRIPNIFLREAATATRGSNMVNATIASRPEWATTAAGAIDFEYVYSTWYHNFAQAYSVKHLNVCTFNAIIISECATALDLNNVGNSNSTGSLALPPLTLTSNFAGGTIQNCKFARAGTPASSGHAVVISYCIGQIFTNIEGHGILFARSTGYAIGSSYSTNLTINSCRNVGLTGVVILTACSTITINDSDHVDRHIGFSNATSAAYGINVGAGSANILVDGLTFGYGGVLTNVHPYTALVYSANGTNITFRNIGTFDSPLPCGTWRQNYYSLGTCFTSGGNNYNLRTQRIYADDNMRTAPFSTTNSDKNISHESIFGGIYIMSAMALYLLLDAGLNSAMKGCKTGANTITGNSSVYGSHFIDMFLGTTTGRYFLAMNEPTADTEAYFTMVSGTRKFNSIGGILMGVVGDQAIFEDQYFRKGHTAFQNTTPTMSGGTIGNYTIEYDIDVNDGNGFTESWTTLSGANLSTETIDPTDGFKLKIRITTVTANLTAITYLRIDTTTTATAQEDNLYPLDLITLTITGLITGSDVVVYATGTTTVRDSVDSNSGTTWDYVYETVENIDIGVFKTGYIPFYIRGYSLSSDDSSVPVAQTVDRAYLV